MLGTPRHHPRWTRPVLDHGRARLSESLWDPFMLRGGAENFCRVPATGALGLAPWVVCWVWCPGVGTRVLTDENRLRPKP